MDLVLQFDFFVNGVLESQFVKDLFDHIMYKITGIWWVQSTILNFIKSALQFYDSGDF